MNFLKKLYYNSASLLPMNVFGSGGPNRILLPYHHLVNNKIVPHISHLYSYKNESSFLKDIEFLTKHFKPIQPDDLYNCIVNDIKIPKAVFLLSFDDGLREVYDVIAPILKQKGIPAIFFINSAFIDNKDLFYRCKISLLIDVLKKNAGLLNLYASVLEVEMNTALVVQRLKTINQSNAYLLDMIAENIQFSFDDFLQKEKPFLTTEQLISLHHQGFTIGAHSIDHPYYHLLKEEEQILQTIGSCNFVKKLTGQDICHFSFPHSDAAVTKKVIASINSKNKGLLFGIQNQKDEMQNNILHRFNAERPGMPFEKLIKGQLLMNYFQKVTGSRNVIRS